MCEFASFVLTKDRALWHPSDDHHEQIIAHHKLERLDRDPIGLVRVEITPNHDSIRDLSTWHFRVDQDVLPDWTFRGDPDLEKRAREALSRRATEEHWFAELSGEREMTGGYASTVTGGYDSTVTGGNHSTVTGGNRSTVTGGDASTVTGGYASTVTGGNRSTVTGGYASTVTGGNRSTVTGGYASTVTGGDDSTVTGGNHSTVTGGDASTVTGGDASTVTGGDASTVTGGNHSTVTGGNRSTVTGGNRSTVTGGTNGILAAKWWDGSRYRLAVGYVGEAGIEAWKAYRVVDGTFVAVDQ